MSLPSMAAGSRPSPPYLNWTMNPSEFRTVRSYCEHRSSSDCEQRERVSELGEEILARNSVALVDGLYLH